MYEKAQQQVKSVYDLAERDNSTIYCEPVPPFVSLAPLAPRAIVKAQLPEAISAPLTASDDPFIYLVPAGVQRELESYRAGVKRVTEGIHASLEAETALARRGREDVATLEAEAAAAWSTTLQLRTALVETVARSEDDTARLLALLSMPRASVESRSGSLPDGHP